MTEQLYYEGSEQAAIGCTEVTRILSRKDDKVFSAGRKCERCVRGNEGRDRFYHVGITVGGGSVSSITV
jgi:hypothetical protein